MIQENLLKNYSVQQLKDAGIVPADCPDVRASMFVDLCISKGLNPINKEAYLLKQSNKNKKTGEITKSYAFIIGIDGLRKLCAATGQLAGQDEVIFNQTYDGKFCRIADLKNAKPLSATATIYRIVAGHKCAFTHTVAFAEFAASYMYDTKGFQMISKVAESFALKKAFGDAVAGFHIEEEVTSFEGNTVADDEYKKHNTPHQQHQEQEQDYWSKLLPIIQDINDKEKAKAAIQEFAKANSIRITAIPSLAQAIKEWSAKKFA